jgi:putative endonuclease
MFYAYVLKSEKDGQFYIGHTDNLERRFAEHNCGKVRSTKHRVPFQLFHYECCNTRSDARWQERKWKSAWGHKQLENIPR